MYVEIDGEVDYVPTGSDRLPAPGLVRPSKNEIPVLRIILNTEGGQMQAIYKGIAYGLVTIGQQIRVKGYLRGGIIHATSIFNITTNSKVTGNQGTRPCFIATAVYGSAMALEVKSFRTFRDVHLSRFNLGRVFIITYEYFSPPIARFIEKKAILRYLVRLLALEPLLVLLKSFLRLGRNLPPSRESR